MLSSSLQAGWEPELGERRCLLLGLGVRLGSPSNPPAKLNVCKRAACTGLSFRQADARCHKEEGYCTGSSVHSPLPRGSQRQTRRGQLGEQPARERFFFFFPLLFYVFQLQLRVNSQQASSFTNVSYYSKSDQCVPYVIQRRV